MIKVFLDGEYLGETNEPEKLIKRIKELRRSGKINYQVNVSYLPYKNSIYISTDSGRIRRPLIVVKNGKPLLTKEHIEKLKKGELTFFDLVKEGIIEFLDAMEEENAIIALTEKDINEKTTHLEIHPSIIFGLHASLIPFVNYARGDRINYGARMSGQAVGIYNLAFNTRADSISYASVYSQVPLVQTPTYQVFPFNTHPNGMNIVVAIVSHPYAMQDAFILNKSSVERGLYWAYMFRTYETDENKYPSGQKDIIGIPQPGVKDYLGEEAYKNLDEDGIVRLETEVKGNDVLIGKVAPLRFISKPERFFLVENLRDASITLRHEDQGVVDRVYITTNQDGNKHVKVIVRDLKVPEIGDKFATRHGQKGVIGLLVRQEDMPFTASGIVPDLILNPHAIPSRMTISQLLEVAFGKVCALEGKIEYDTQFGKVNEEYIVELLKKYGFEESGREEMYDPRTGKKYEVKILIGVGFVMRLYHMASNKKHARARGPVTLLTRQPTEGRVKEGGLRLGEMEKDVLIAHGAAITLKERFDSDKTLVPVCTNCGLIAWKNYLKNEYYCPVCKDGKDVIEVEMSYAFKLLLQELYTMLIYPKLIVDKDLKKVISIEFNIFTPELIKKYSIGKIVKSELYDEEGYPIEGGLMDPRLGTIDPGIRCRTCYGNFVTCVGHFGHIELAKPVIHPLFVRFVYNVLRAFCKNCYKYLSKEKKSLKSLLKSLPSKCPHCGKEQPKIELVLPYTIKIDEKEVDKGELKEFLSKIPNEELEKAGIKIRPEHVILNVILVPPPRIRPSIVLETGERSEDDLTHKLVDILRVNKNFLEALEAGVPEFIVKDFSELLQYHVATFYDNELSNVPPARHRSGRVLKGLVQRLEAKEGRFRYNLLGKRVNFSARAVISPDPYIDIDEVGVPLEFAKILTVPEVVNEENKEFLKILVLNADKWPGANYVIKPDGTKIKIMEKNKNLIAEMLDVGWIVERHLLNGDVVLFNRQPSLHRMSMLAHKVVVMPGKTFRINLCTTIPYNADFDGDEMNLHVLQSKEAMAEAELLAGVIKHIRSPRYSGPIIALLHDQITGLFLLTYKIEEMNYKDVVQLVRNIDLNIEIPRKEKFSGKEIFSLFLPKISIEFKNNLINIEKEKGITKIENGKLVSGVIDKKAVGENGKLLNRILSEYGEFYTKKFIENISKLGMSIALQHGISISYKDYEVSKELLKQKEEIIKSGEQQIFELIEKFRKGKIEKIIGRTSEEVVEQEINRIISDITTKVGNLILQNINKENEVFWISASGARGSLINYIQISGLVGQERIMGERIKIGYYLRTFPHFELNDISARAKGFVIHGFKEGLDPFEVYFEAINSREGLMDKGVKTRQSGYLERRFIGALQDLRVEFDLTVRDSSGNVIQFIAGEDGIDPTKIESDFNYEQLYRIS